MTFKKMLPARSFVGPLERIGPLVPGSLLVTPYPNDRAYPRSLFQKNTIS
jgi:hypothetical protein